jgi:hypothetical protein
VATAVAVSISRELDAGDRDCRDDVLAPRLRLNWVDESDREIDALETMAINPIVSWVTPGPAMIVMLPCLTIWANSWESRRVVVRRPKGFGFVQYIKASTVPSFSAILQPG